MSTFKMFLKIVKGHKSYFLIYLILLGAFGLAAGGFSNAFNTDAGEVPYQPLNARIAIIDRDGSKLSKSIVSYLSKDATVVPLEDTERAIQDAVATNRAEYILVIPRGWGEGVMRAAQAGEQAPNLQTYISFATASGFVMDTKVQSYVQILYAFAAGDALQNAVTQSSVVQCVENAAAEKMEGFVIPQDAAPVSGSLSGYLKFSIYPLFTSIAVMIATVLNRMNRKEIQERLLATPETSRGRNFGIFWGCLTVGIAAWLYISLLGVVFYGCSLLSHNVEALVWCLFALLAFSFFAASFGFFIGQLKVSENMSNAIGNVMGLALSALGGGWISVELFPDSIQQLVHFIPSYWMSDIVSRVSVIPVFTPETRGVLGMDLLIMLLFGAAFFFAAMVVGRNKAKEEL